MHTPSKSIHDIVQQMQRLVPPGVGEPQTLEVLDQLRSLTKNLIQAYRAAGRLQEDPFHEARMRPLRLYTSQVCQQLENKVVLVTGGEGCVGSHLIARLVELGVKRIISIDNVRCGKASTCEPQVLQPTASAALVLYAADIRDYSALEPIFAAEKPDIVFHVAAQRHPGLAEKQIRETITTNVFGTQTIIRLCEAFGVQHCVFSSTGKASRYFTAEVYAASKKICEGLFAEAAQRGKVRYGMVRFTHMLENSSMCEQIDEKVYQGKPINIHAPDRYVAGQNVGEAVHLLLNALVFSEPERLKFLLVRNLGWPAESLEVALYKILQSKQDLPIYFQGIQPGYEESFFLGQVDWDDQIDINTLINALETAYASEISCSGDMIVAASVPFSAAVLTEQLSILKALSQDVTVSEQQLKQALADAVREVARSSFLQITPQKLLKILKWGINPKRYELGELNLAAYQDIVELLVSSLCDTFTVEALNSSSLSMQEFEHLLQVLATLPSIQTKVAHLRSLISTPLSNKAIVTV